MAIVHPPFYLDIRSRLFFFKVMLRLCPLVLVCVFYSHFQILLLVIIYSAMLLVFITYVKMLRGGKASTNDVLLTCI